jgi:hypothetical protein
VSDRAAQVLLALSKDVLKRRRVMSDNPELNEDDDVNVTTEVGSEGGSPGDVEVGEDAQPAGGSEADETWQPAKQERKEVARDETGQGRRSP